MALPQPVPGLVIRYSYLWHAEYLEGREEGKKDRPCAIVAAIRRDEAGSTRVLVLPITHRPPEQAALAIEIPAKVKRHLRLDEAPSWAILTEWNEFAWPGPDLRRVPDTGDFSVAHGMLPPSFFASIRDRFLALAKSGQASPVRRT
jgi:hypothetical protein